MSEGSGEVEEASTRPPLGSVGLRANRAESSTHAAGFTRHGIFSRIRRCRHYCPARIKPFSPAAYAAALPAFSASAQHIFRCVLVACALFSARHAFLFRHRYSQRRQHQSRAAPAA